MPPRRIARSSASTGRSQTRSGVGIAAPVQSGGSTPFRPRTAARLGRNRCDQRREHSRGRPFAKRVTAPDGPSRWKPSAIMFCRTSTQKRGEASEERRLARDRIPGSKPSFVDGSFAAVRAPLERGATRNCQTGDGVTAVALRSALGLNRVRRPVVIVPTPLLELPGAVVPVEVGPGRATGGKPAGRRVDQRSGDHQG